MSGPRALALLTAFASCGIAAPSVAGTSAPPPAAVPADFAPIAFLLGSWSGSGTSDVGAGTGSDVFDLEVENRAVVRRAHAVYPAAAGHPASTYDAMMIVYRDAAYPTLRADYIDNGGHAIHYALVAGTDPHVVRFVSDAVPNAPRFRLTYTCAPDDKSMRVVFEMQPPGASDFVVTIADGTDVRRAL